MKYIDVHAHYEDVLYKNDLEKELLEIKDAGIEYIINAGTSIEESKKSIELAMKYNYIYSTIGIHPYMTNEIDRVKELEEIYKEYKDRGKIVAIGEIGLDYHITKENKKEQIILFKEQLKLARKLNLPVQIHSREATEDMLDIIKNTKDLPEKIMFHCFDLNEEVAKQIILKKYYISVGGNITYKRNDQAIRVLESIPIEQIMLETDAPYLTPTPKRGERNSSKYLYMILDRLSQVKCIEKEKLSEILYQNAVSFYNLKK